MNIPAIGGARGLFDIFVPGMFLLLNLALVVYSSPFVDDETKSFIVSSASNPVLALVIAVGFGYLVGVLLRLFRTEVADKWSAAWLRRFHRHVRQDDGEFALWATEEFPYIGWIEEVCKRYLPPEALDFFKETWGPRKRKGQNRQFFNFCKVMINSVDERAADEFNAAEALSRYIAGMFYALVLAFLLILGTVILRYIYFGQTVVGLVIILFAYLFAIVVILSYFRFVRIKEVESVFVASFKNKSIFEEKSLTTDEKGALKTLPNWLQRLLCRKRLTIE